MERYQKKALAKNRNGLTSFRSNWQLYIMALPAIALLFMFNYMPMFGTIIAFKKYKVLKGILGSDWANPWYRNFKLMFRANGGAVVAIKNTLILNLMFIAIGTIVSLALALMLNELRSRFFKKITQSFIFLPYFISAVVMGLFANALLSIEKGTINNIRTFFGFARIDFYSNAKMWPGILLAFHIWKNGGYGAVVYIATIGGIDSSYYEAARIDGATRWQETRYISLPLLRPTVIVLTLLSIGRIMNSDFGFFYMLVGDNPLLYPTADVIDTFIFRALRNTGDMGVSSATGLFQSTVSFILVLTSNMLARKIDKDAALF